MSRPLRVLHSLVRTPLFAVVATVTLGLSSPAFARDAALKPGKYDGTYGMLTVRQEQDRSLSFELTAVSRNGDICGLEGRIEHLRARLSLDAEGSAGKDVCVVDFVPSHDGIEIRTNGLHCQQFCGAGASYEIVEGLYTPDVGS